MYKMMEVCQKTGLNYEKLKFYCNQGLIPNVKRDANNRRVFDDNDLNWIKDLICLKKCSMSIPEIKNYLALCLAGKSSIPTRQTLLAQKEATLVQKQKELQASIDYIHHKQKLYHKFLDGSLPYQSNLIQ